MKMSRSSITEENGEGRRDVGSFLEPREPSITDPRMRPRPPHGTRLFRDETAEPARAALRVYLRLKPQPPEAGPAPYTLQSDTALATRKNSKTEVYKFTHIFRDCSQGAVFNKIVKDRLSRFVEGRDFTLMTYGASGSGKTYSLMGTDSQPGVIPRSLEFLFAQVSPEDVPRFKPTDSDSLQELTILQQKKEVAAIESIRQRCGDDVVASIAAYRRMSTALTRASRAWHHRQRAATRAHVWVSFAELYNEAAFDLLRERSPAPPARLRILQPSGLRPYLKDLRWVCVRSAVEAYALLVCGRANLRYAHTNVNATSSRSHCIFTIKLVQHTDDGAKISTFRLCDLAGSERVKMTENSGERLNESCKINTSLHVLERCLAALRERQAGQRTMPPYRESKLTTLLQRALSGQEAVAMLVTVNPQPRSFEETQHVLKFSTLARVILVEESDQQRMLVASSGDEGREGEAEVEALRRLLREERARAELAEAELSARALRVEAEVRRDTSAKFLTLLDKAHRDWARRLAQERTLAQEQHEVAQQTAARREAELRAELALALALGKCKACSEKEDYPIFETFDRTQENSDEFFDDFVALESSVPENAQNNSNDQSGKVMSPVRDLMPIFTTAPSPTGDLVSISIRSTSCTRDLVPSPTRSTSPIGDVVPISTGMTSPTRDLVPISTRVTSPTEVLFAISTKLTSSTADLVPISARMTSSTEDLVPISTRPISPTRDVVPISTRMTSPSRDLVPISTRATSHTDVLFGISTKLTSPTADVVPISTRTTSSTEDPLPTITVATSPAEIVRRYQFTAGLPEVQRYFTDKKQKPDNTDKENCGSARRKLFSRQRLDMLAAEPFQPLACDLVLEPNSPDIMRPPALPQPYTLRSKK